MSEQKQIDFSQLSREYDKVDIDTIDFQDGQKFNRPIKRVRVEKIKKVFDPVMCSPLLLYVLSKPKGKKTFGVVDGQHTATAVVELNPPPGTLISATIISEESAKQLVEKFKRVNENKKCVTETEKFWADHYAKENDVIAVKSIIERFNIPVVRKRSHNIPSIINVGRLREMYVQYGEEVFGKTFEVIRNSFWDRQYVQSKAIENYFILGLMQLVEEYPEMDKRAFRGYSAAEIETKSNSVKTGGHKNKRIYIVLRRLYRSM